MDAHRLAYLRQESDAERLSYGDIAEIEEAFRCIDPATLRDLPENAMASDMIEELEDRIGRATTRTAWVCVDCNAAVAGISDHEAGKRLPEPFKGDESVVQVVNGLSDCHHFGIDWHNWPEHVTDEHAEQCETRTFDTSPCEGCGDHLAGTRQAVTITVR